MEKHHKMGLALIAVIFLSVSSAPRVADECLKTIGGGDPVNALFCSLTGEDAELLLL